MFELKPPSRCTQHKVESRFGWATLTCLIMFDRAQKCRWNLSEIFWDYTTKENMGCHMSPANDQYTSLVRTKYTNQKVRFKYIQILYHPTNEKLEPIWKHQFGISALQIANQHWLLRHRPGRWRISGLHVVLVELVPRTPKVHRAGTVFRLVMLYKSKK